MRVFCGSFIVAALTSSTTFAQVGLYHDVGERGTSIQTMRFLSAPQTVQRELALYNRDTGELVSGSGNAATIETDFSIQLPAGRYLLGTAPFFTAWFDNFQFTVTQPGPSDNSITTVNHFQVQDFADGNGVVWYEFDVENPFPLGEIGASLQVIQIDTVPGTGKFGLETDYPTSLGLWQRSSGDLVGQAQDATIAGEVISGVFPGGEYALCVTGNAVTFQHDLAVVPSAGVAFGSYYGFMNGYAYFGTTQDASVHGPTSDPFDYYSITIEDPIHLGTVFALQFFDIEVEATGFSPSLAFFNPIGDLIAANHTKGSQVSFDDAFLSPGSYAFAVGNSSHQYTDGYGVIVGPPQTGSYTVSAGGYTSSDTLNGSLPYDAYDFYTFDVAAACDIADIAVPAGVLDLNDVTAFAAAFLAGDMLADLAAPTGVLDLNDINAFISAFVAGCP